MASRSGPHISNFIVVPDDATFQFIGRGLVVNNHEHQRYPQSFDVCLGDGLAFDSDNAITLNLDPTGGLTLDQGALSLDPGVLAGQGLVTDGKKLDVKIGYGLTFGDQLELKLAVDPGCETEIDPASLVGRGLQLDGSKLDVSIGDGLAFGNLSEVNIDVTDDPSQAQVFHAVTNITIDVQGNNLVLDKTVTTFNVRRNRIGLVISIEQGNSVVETETVKLPIGGYGYGGYGYGGYNLAALAHSNPGRPNFYKK